MSETATTNGTGSRTLAAAITVMLVVTALVAGPVAAQDAEPVPCPTTTTTTTTTTLPPREGLAKTDLPPADGGAATTEDCVPAAGQPAGDSTTTTTIATTTTAPRLVVAVDDQITAVQGASFDSFEVTANDTISPSLATLEVVSGQMPAGLTLWDSGALRGWVIGTAEECGNFTVDYRIQGTSTDEEPPDDTATVTIEVFCDDAVLPVAASDDNFSAAVDRRIEVDVVVNDQPTAAVAWIELESGELPAGTTLWAGGWLTGTPTEVGRYSFTYRVNGAAGETERATVTITVE